MSACSRASPPMLENSTRSDRFLVGGRKPTWEVPFLHRMQSDTNRSLDDRRPKPFFNHVFITGCKTSPRTREPKLLSPGRALTGSPAETTTYPQMWKSTYLIETMQVRKLKRVRAAKLSTELCREFVFSGDAAHPLIRTRVKVSKRQNRQQPRNKVLHKK